MVLTAWYNTRLRRLEWVDCLRYAHKYIQWKEFPHKSFNCCSFIINIRFIYKWEVCISDSQCLKHTKQWSLVNTRCGKLTNIQVTEEEMNVPLTFVWPAPPHSRMQQDQEKPVYSRFWQVTWCLAALWSLTFWPVWPPSLHSLMQHFGCLVCLNQWCSGRPPLLNLCKIS